jgi:hypothetical protein
MTMRIAFILLVGCGRLGFGESGPAVPKAQPPTDNLLAYWDFENATTGGVMSEVSTDMATCTGAECAVEVTGAVGMGLSFDGANNAYHVASLTSWSGPEYTISVWTLPQSASTGTADPIIMRSSGGCSSPSIRTDGSRVAFAAFDTSNTHQYAWTSDILVAQTWQQVAIRWDGTTQAVFVNGQCACQNVPTVPLTVSPTTEFTFGIDANDNRRLAGDLDEVRIYDRALTDDEMATLAGIGNYAVPPTTPCTTPCSVTSAFP